jgi:CheY-like chemotaxis protein
MIAGSLELAFEGLGWTMVGPATRVSEALAQIKTESFDVVLLDVNLAGEMSWDVASALKESGIPFVLTTGYELENLQPDFLRGSKVVRKPFKLDILEQAVLDAIKEKRDNYAGR